MTAARGTSYLDIVWQQFRQNRPAYWSGWFLLPVLAIAIFAPLLASNRPLVFHDGAETIYPWLRDLFHQPQPIDYYFNMSLLCFPVWLPLAIALNHWSKGVGWPGRRRLGVALLLLAGMTAVLCGVFALPGVFPGDIYFQRDFARDELARPDECSGVYAPIPFGPREQDLHSVFKGPGWRLPRDKWSESNDGVMHLLGTDDAGRDIVVHLIYGTRIAITIGIFAVGLYVSIGIVMGALAGYFGGRIDSLISRAIEVVLLFPAFFLILIVVALLGPSIYNIMWIIGLTSWPTVARLIRGEVLKQRAIDYTAAARVLGASHLRIIFRHILPNSMSPIFVTVPFGIASAIVTEAGLSVLGFGARPPAVTWGNLLRVGKEDYGNWWLIVFPSLAILAVVTMLNQVGAGLRDAMDPRLRTASRAALAGQIPLRPTPGPMQSKTQAAAKV